MAQAVLSILTMEKWMKNRQKSIFNSLHIPTQCNQTTIGNAILLKCAPFEVIYPDPEFLAEAVDIWSSIKVDEWQKVADALELEYDAISNYDRTETTTDVTSITHTGGKVETHSGTDTTTNSNSNTTSETHSGTDTVSIGKDEVNTIVTNDTSGVTGYTSVENETSAFDALRSNPYVPKDKNTTSNSSSVESETSTSNTLVATDYNSTLYGHEINTGGTSSGSSALAYGHGINETNNSTDDISITHTSRISGNIGVTTSQQMLQSEIELRLNNDISELIVEEFKKEFCILTY